MVVHKHTHYLLIGPNGSGKTAHGRALAGSIGRGYADMSRILKIAGAFCPGLRDEIMDYSSKGKLVPDEITMAQFDIYMSTHQMGSSLIFMGVPRTAAQVRPFIESIERHVGYSAMKVADLRLSPEIAIARCKARAEDDIKNNITPRADDLDEKIIKDRLEAWNAERAAFVETLEDYAEVIPVECVADKQATYLAIARALDILPAQFFIQPAQPVDVAVAA